jgi:hypothetical protein
MKSETKSARRKTVAPAPKPERPKWPSATEATEAQKRAGAAARERLLKRRQALPFKARQLDGAPVQLGPTITEERLAYDWLADVCGTQSDAWINALVQGLVNVQGGKADSSPPDTALQGLAFLNGIAPRDEVEAALGAQMFAIHMASMTLAQRVGAAEQRDQYRDYGNLLVKTTRTFAAQVEALAKLRNGGKQQVEVRYVYVDARGGQNVIGSEIHAGGGGMSGRNGDQSHATARLAGLPFAPGAPVWGPDPQRDAVPIAGGSEPEAVPNARRDEPRSAERTRERQLQDWPMDGGGDRGATADPSPGESSARGSE